MNAKELGEELVYPQVTTEHGVDAAFQEREWIYSTGGMTKRELFAAMAMQGILSDPSTNSPYEKRKELRAAVSESAVGFADALLAELAKDTP